MVGNQHNIYIDLAKPRNAAPQLSPCILLDNTMLRVLTISDLA